MSPPTYIFSKALSFSSNATDGCLVATIPVIAVGFLGIAVATFLFFVRRLDIPLACVCGSAFLEFLGALFDVSQILVRGKAEVHVYNSTVTSLMLARDIFFSFAAGARFFAFWTIVALCPRGEAKIMQARWKDNASDNMSTHSGSWMRWGAVGIVLKWFTAAMAVAIALMQILWRSIDQFDNLGSVYAAESALQVILSVVFIVKLCLNIAITECPSRWIAALDYSPLFLALLFNFALGVGNIAVFPFSESTAGRLMIATELYIVLETLLCWKFYGAPVVSLTHTRIDEKRSSFGSLGPSWKEEEENARADRAADTRRPNMLSRLSGAGLRAPSWMQPRLSSLSLSGRHRPALSRDEARLYNPQDAEQGISQQSPTYTGRASTTTYDYSPAEALENARYPDPVYTSFFQDTQRDYNENAGRRVQPKPPAPSTIASFYARPDTTDGQSLIVPPPAAVTTGGASSPIYGLSGTLRAGRFSPVSTTATFSPMVKTLEAPRPPLPVNSSPLLQPPRALEDEGGINSTRSSGYNQLLREQEDLEKSIAQLRLYSTSQVLDNIVISDLDDGRPGVARENSDGSSGRPPLSSGASEFSLSVFPDPPLVRRSSQVQPTVLDDYVENMPPAARTQSHSRKNTDDSRINVGIERATMDFRDAMMMSFRDSGIDLPPPRMPAAQDTPSSTRTSEDSISYEPPKSRLDSNGTQYDVTSFIGTLTVPAHKKTQSSLSVVTNAPPLKADDESETISLAGSASFAQIVAVERRPSEGKVIRAYRVEGDADARASVPAPAAPARAVAVPTRSMSADDASPKPDSPTGGRVSPTSSTGRVSPTSGRQVEFGRTASGRAAGLPARPRMINSPTIAEEESRSDPPPF